MNAIKSVHVSCKTWRDKTYGNSYFSARVYFDGELVATVPFQYGYGSHYDATCLLAVADKLCPEVESRKRQAYLSSQCRELGIAYTQDVYPVSKRDCKKFGER